MTRNNINSEGKEHSPEERRNGENESRMIGIGNWGQGGVDKGGKAVE